MLAFRAYLWGISKGTKTKQKTLCSLVYFWLYFARKGKKAKLELKNMPFCRAQAKAIAKNIKAIWPSKISSPGVISKWSTMYVILCYDIA